MGRNRQIMKGVKFPKSTIQRVLRIAKQEGSSFSQVVKTALLKDLQRRDSEPR